MRGKIWISPCQATLDILDGDVSPDSTRICYDAVLNCDWVILDSRIKTVSNCPTSGEQSGLLKCECILKVTNIEIQRN